VPGRDRDGVGRDGVAQLLLTDGPATATSLATRLGVSATAVRRHLDHLVADGLVEARERPPYGPAPRRGRGRPARVFSLTPAGRAGFPTAYDDLALAAIEHLRRHGGDAAVAAFAQSRAAELEAVLGQLLDSHRPADDIVPRLAAALSELGFAASAEPAPGGYQLCQHHCPVAHVAERFPQLCEAETEALSRVLGSHVQRLATIAHGDGVCTTVIPTVRTERSTA
jgi:predicted ArsR family transcriptional regulator